MAMTTLINDRQPGQRFLRTLSGSLLLAVCLAFVGGISSSGSHLADSTIVHAQTPAGNRIQVSADDLGPPAPPAPPAGGAGPSIQFETLDHDWGTVLQGTVIEFTYKFRNIGSEVLRITNVKPG